MNAFAEMAVSVAQSISEEERAALAQKAGGVLRPDHAR